MTEEKWWKEAVFYEIYMPSFCDGNDDGIGDFKGIITKLDYLKELGVNGLWLTPFYKSPKIDNGYDIENYYEVDPDYGTMEDFKHFLEEAHKRGIRVIADLVLNHTSDKHQWFVESRSSKNSAKRDWYIWREGNGQEAPNNWESFFSGSAWEFDRTTDEYYYHAFAKEQVDLNWSNPEVKKAMFEVVRYWLQLGVDGFRLDVINFLKIEKQLKDNPYDEKGNQVHLNDKDQQGLIDIIKELRALIDSYGEKFLVGEVGSEDLKLLMEYAGEELLHVVFNFNLGSIEEFNLDKIYGELNNMNTFSRENTPTLFFGSHDMPRFISRFSDGTLEEERAKLLATLMLTGKGVPFIYFGDEIGMRNFHAKEIGEMRDVQGILAYKKALLQGKCEEEALRIGNNSSRDKSRTPMQWTDDIYSGFSSVQPWINIPVDYRRTNVAIQNQISNSMLNYYKKLIETRKQYKSLQYGEYKLLSRIGKILFFIREYNSEEILCIFNFSKEVVPMDHMPSGFDKMLLSSRRQSFDKGTKLELLPLEVVIMGRI